MDDVSEKYSQVRGIDKDTVTFLLDGSEIREYEMVEELNIKPKSKLFAHIQK